MAGFGDCFREIRRRSVLSYERMPENLSPPSLFLSCCPYPPSPHPQASGKASCGHSQQAGGQAQERAQQPPTPLTMDFQAPELAQVVAPVSAAMSGILLEQPEQREARLMAESTHGVSTARRLQPGRDSGSRRPVLEWELERGGPAWAPPESRGPALQRRWCSWREQTWRTETRKRGWKEEGPTGLSRSGWCRW